MSNILNQLNYYISGLYFPVIHVIDIIEILIIALMIYFCMVWIQRTRAYSLLKGFLVIVVFTVIADMLQMSVILWIVSRLASVALLALFIIFQPELRKGLESLGTRNFLTSFFTSSDRSDTISDRTITEIVRAVNEMSEMRTGALIVIEQNILLTEYIETGIRLNADVSSQLLINIFEHNTPLHDGAVIMRGDQIVAATCYLPLSENSQLNKRYGTRHRAGLGISEASDSFTIIVSEETGRVSYAMMGNMTTGVASSNLREALHRLQKKGGKEKEEKRLRFRKGQINKHEE